VLREIFDPKRDEVTGEQDDKIILVPKGAEEIG
jgi:hypothetical protein